MFLDIMATRRLAALNKATYEREVKRARRSALAEIFPSRNPGNTLVWCWRFMNEELSK